MLCCNCKIFYLVKSIKIQIWRVIFIILIDKVAEKDSVYRDCRGDSSNCSVFDYLCYCQLVCYYGNQNVRQIVFNMVDLYKENLELYIIIK